MNIKLLLTSLLILSVTSSICFSTVNRCLNITEDKGQCFEPNTSNMLISKEVIRQLEDGSEEYHDFNVYFYKNSKFIDRYGPDRFLTLSNVVFGENCNYSIRYYRNTASEKVSRFMELLAEVKLATVKKTLKSTPFKGLLWRVTHSNGDKVFLIGTVHYGTIETKNLNSNIKSMVNQSDIVASEIDMRNLSFLAAFKSKLLTGYKYPHLFSFLNAIYVALKLSGLSTTYYIDKYVLAYARENGVVVEEIENIRSQIKMLGEISEKVVAAKNRYLRSPSRSMSGLKYINRFLRISKGDLEGFNEALSFEVGTGDLSIGYAKLQNAIYDRLIYKRNLVMNAV